MGLQPAQVTSSTTVAGKEVRPAFTKPGDQKVAQIAYEVIRRLENQPQTLPSVEDLKRPEIQAAIVKAVEEQRVPAQMELEGVTEKPDIAAVVARTVEQFVQDTISIPTLQPSPRMSPNAKCGDYLPNCFANPPNVMFSAMASCGISA